MGANAVRISKGDDKSLRLTVVDGTGAAVDTTGWTIKFTAKTKGEASSALISKTSATPGEIDFVSPNPNNNLWDINLVPADTSSQMPGVYVYDVEATTTDATPKIHTLLVDSFTVDQDVTN